ncbi:hypothetical protein CGC21_33590 [Leishmania donovani]|uniref:Uncharacterized protein n=2 Tax=Leishmania donovani TaxID=5661 RepID=A0A504XJV5_LEIDO|nr:hypothetical protein CGC21_33590 [Leishmania donovani]
MSVPDLTAEELAYYASLRLEDPDEAALAAFLADVEQAHEGHPSDTGTAPSSNVASAIGNGGALLTPSWVPAGARLDSSDVEGVPPQRGAASLDRQHSSTFVSTGLAIRRISARLFPAPRSATTDSGTRYGVTQVLEKDSLVGGVAGIADAALQTRCVELPARQLTSIAPVQCFLNATHVYLQHNALAGLEGVELLSQLQVLVVHHNQLTSLAPLQQLECLSYLDVNHNNVSSSVDVLLRDELPCPSLKSLNLSNNPCWSRCGGAVSDGDGGERHRAYVQQICTACPLLERLDDLDVDDGEEVVQHSDSSTESGVNDVAERRSASAAGITVRRVQGSVEAARAASSHARVHDIHTRSSPAPPGSLASGEAELSARPPRSAHVNKARLLEEEQARLVQQLFLRRAAGTAPESPKAVNTVSASPLHPNRSRTGSGHFHPRDAAKEAPAEQKTRQPADSTADVSALYSTRGDTLQLYHNLQFTQEVSQARLQRDVVAHWDDVSRVLQTVQALQQDRRRRIQQRLQEQTSAYTESLIMLEKESFTKDLDRYRSSDGSRRGAPTGINAAASAPVAPPAVATPNAIAAGGAGVATLAREINMPIRTTGVVTKTVAIRSIMFTDPPDKAVPLPNGAGEVSAVGHYGVAAEYMLTSEADTVRLPGYVTCEGAGGVKCLAALPAHAAGCRVMALSSSEANVKQRLHCGVGGLARLGVLTGAAASGCWCVVRRRGYMAVNGNFGLKGTREGFHLDQMLMERMLITGIRVGQRRHFEDMLELMALHKALPVLDAGHFKLTELPVVCRHLQT